MPLSDIKSVGFQAQLLQENGLALRAFNTTVQFFDLKSNVWQVLATGLISDEKGMVVQTLNFNKTNKENIAFFESLRQGYAPQLRLITTESTKLAVKEIVSLSAKSVYTESSSTFLIVFGKCFQLNKSAKAILGVDKTDNTQLAFVPFVDTVVYAELEQTKTQLAQCNAQNNKLKEAYTVVQQKLDSSNLAYQKLQEEQAVLAANHKELLASNRSLEQRIQQLQADNKQLKADGEQWAKLSEEAKMCQQKLEATSVELEKAALVSQRAIELNKKYEQSLKAQNAELLKLNVEYAELEHVIVEHNDTILQLKDQLAKDKLQLEDFRKMNLSLSEKIESLNKQISSATTVNQKEYKPTAQPVNKVYSSIISEFQKTNELTKDSNFKLTNISLNIKTFIEHDDDGVRLQLVDAQKLKDINSAALSDFSIDIKDTTSTTTSNSSLTMPDMIGLTESAARRVADTLGLRIKSVYQYVNAKVPNGQCFKQSPLKGSALVANDIITLIFAKKNN